MKTIIAIDPGASGGIAVLRCDGTVMAWPMPDTEQDVCDLIGEQWSAQWHSPSLIAVFVERVGGYAGKRQPGSAMFKFGFNCGVIEGCLRTLKLPTAYVRPQQWQKHFSLGTATACATKTIWKGKLKSEAQRRFPHLKVTLATADALLLMEYGRSTNP